MAFAPVLAKWLGSFVFISRPVEVAGLVSRSLSSPKTQERYEREGGAFLSSMGLEISITSLGPGFFYSLIHLWSRADEKPNQEDLQPRGPRTER